MDVNPEYAGAWNLASRVAVVTAAGSGTGREIARVFALGGAVEASHGRIDIWINCAGLSIYGATKAAVNSLTWAPAKERGPMGIRVNAVAPGWIETSAMGVLYRDVDGNFDAGIRDATYAQARASSPVGRLGTPTDIAFAVAYLASDAASFITGQVLRVNGGESM